MGHKAERSARIIATYRDAMQLMGELNRAVYDVACKPCIEGESRKRGTGCCNLGVVIYKMAHGPAAEEIRDLWAQASAGRIPASRSACIYHDAEDGCMLGDLKPPICATHYCSKAAGRMQDELGTEIVKSRLMAPLEAILMDRDERFDPGMMGSFQRYVAELMAGVRAAKADSGVEALPG